MAENDKQQDIYINRELSWLQFNSRVLEEAEKTSVPLYERLKFVSIFANNLDEFYMVRVGSIFDQTLLQEPTYDSKTGMSSKEQLEHIYKATKALLPRRDKAYFDIMAELEQKGIRHIDAEHMTKDEESYFMVYFAKQVRPLLSPQVIDKTHPFPFLENKKLFVGVRFQTKNDKEKLGIIPVEPFLERMLFVKDKEGQAFLLMEDLIQHFAAETMQSQKIVEKTVLRITRNADIDVDDNMVDTDLDYRKAMEELLKKRRKLMPVRLEVSGEISDEMKSILCTRLMLDAQQVFCCHSPLDLSFGFAMEKKPFITEDMLFSPLKPQRSADVQSGVPMFDQVMQHDILLHYPYQDIRHLIRLLEESASDPEVTSIRISLYRVASDSKIINALIRASENGKDVDVVVELKARFDEMNNIDWSKQLEEAGCHVVYGLDGYKVHSKLLLIVRRHNGHIQYLSHIGTGNFNEKTAKIYTDLALLTGNQKIGSEVSATFNNLFMGQTTASTDLLLVAPHCFKNKVIELIDNEIAVARSGEPARIELKMNSLTDKMLINKLVEASQSGVMIRMVVRGICCLKAGVPGYTDHIKVISIVGRFLEHSRIYIFGIGERQKVYISSADFMTRNTERRVEVAAPIQDPALVKRLQNVLDVMFRDNVQARKMLPDGSFVPVVAEGEAVNAQELFYHMAYEQATVPKVQEQPSLPPKKEGFLAAFLKLFKSK